MEGELTFGVHDHFACVQHYWRLVSEANKPRTFDEKMINQQVRRIGSEPGR